MRIDPGVTARLKARDRPLFTGLWCLPSPLWGRPMALRIQKLKESCSPRTLPATPPDTKTPIYSELVLG